MLDPTNPINVASWKQTTRLLSPYAFDCLMKGRPQSMLWVVTRLLAESPFVSDSKDPEYNIYNKQIHHFITSSCFYVKKITTGDFRCVRLVGKGQDKLFFFFNPVTCAMIAYWWILYYVTVTTINVIHRTDLRVCVFISFPGFRHIRLRTPQNVPLELASLFVFTRLEEMQDTSDKTKLLEAQQKRQMLSNMVYYHIGRERSSKMEFIEVRHRSKCHDHLKGRLSPFHFLCFLATPWSLALLTVPVLSRLPLSP